MKTHVFLIILLFLSGCGIRPAPKLNLDNIAIPSSWSQKSTITLKNGSYSEEAAPNSATKTKISTTEYFANGIINNQKVVAAILITDLGGSATFYDLFLFANKENGLHYITQTPLGDRIRINRIGVTENMIKVSFASHAPDTAMGAEPDLPLIKSFKLEGNQLKEPCQPEATPTKTNPPPTALAGKTFYWQSSIYGNDTQETPHDPRNYSITFNKDWTISIHADCVDTGGFFGLHGSKLTIQPASPVTTCKTGSLSSVFLRNLGAAVHFFSQKDTVYIDLIYDSGTLILTKQP